MTFETTRISIIVDAVLNNGATGSITVREDTDGDGEYEREQTEDLINGRIRYAGTELSSNLINNDVQIVIETNTNNDVTTSVQINDIQIEY